MVRITKVCKALGSLVIVTFVLFIVLHNNLCEKENNSSRYLKNILKCSDIIPRQSYFGQRGNNWVFYNYFRATRQFGCDETITYTTHADWTFLDILEPLLKRWQGPLSVALYCPGTDFPDSIRRIQYLRECIDTTLIKDLVTFHLVFDQDHVPKEDYIREPGLISVDCEQLRSLNLTFGDSVETYKKANNLTYPINMLRNVARESATTHFVLPLDIELFPSPDLIHNFLKMIKRNDSVLQTVQPKVFVLPVFEVDKNVTRLPISKAELIYMLRNGSAVPFHKYTCLQCHRIPNYDEWRKPENLQNGLNVFHIGKRYKPYEHWEPFFIGTRFEPIFDERLTWEGKSNKMTQNYILCVLDYVFLILDNAFLVHKPGIKKLKGGGKVTKLMAKQSKLIANKIVPELNIIYGTRDGCVV